MWRIVADKDIRSQAYLEDKPWAFELTGRLELICVLNEIGLPTPISSFLRCSGAVITLTNLDSYSNALSVWESYRKEDGIRVDGGEIHPEADQITLSEYKASTKIGVGNG